MEDVLEVRRGVQRASRPYTPQQAISWRVNKIYSDHCVAGLLNDCGRIVSRGAALRRDGFSSRASALYV